MFCPNCGNECNSDAKFCPGCGRKLDMGAGQQEQYQEANQEQGGYTYDMPNYNTTYDMNSNQVIDKDKKIVAGLLAILLGALGIHKFYLGYTTTGIIMLLVTILTCGLGGAVMEVIGIIEGVLYLTKTNEEFYDTYVWHQKTWF